MAGPFSKMNSLTATYGGKKVSDNIATDAGDAGTVVTGNPAWSLAGRVFDRMTEDYNIDLKDGSITKRDEA